MRLRSSSSMPSESVCCTMACAVRAAPPRSASSPSASQRSRSSSTWCRLSDLMAFSMTFSTTSGLPLASSSLAAVIQICGSVGMVSRALLSTLRAFWYVSSRASASHMSTLCGTHSTARPSMSRASSGGSRSIAACQSLTLLGTTSSARRSTRRRIMMLLSSEAACSQILTDCGIFFTASASTVLAFSGVCSRAASSHTSSFAGHAMQPSRITCRALTSLPATSSSRAAAIQPGPCPGLVEVTDLRSSRAFLMSPTSASVLILIELRSVR
mmetsp:Transcript_29080/g.68543  ORF Transcript_29080/g.68543 Transcript_29080/m.68543 type:complete len:270 (+) Transcript_29080:249-1058(+)